MSSCLSGDGDDGSAFGSAVNVRKGERATGSKRISTDFYLAEIAIETSCPTWLLTMQGYVAPTPRPASGGSCHPSYRGVCLKQGIGDYDCSSGTGNGPNYVRGPVDVVGPDEFDLDRDGDGVGCENG